MGSIDQNGERSRGCGVAGWQTNGELFFTSTTQGETRIDVDGCRIRKVYHIASIAPIQDRPLLVAGKSITS